MNSDTLTYCEEHIDNYGYVTCDCPDCGEELEVKVE